MKKSPSNTIYCAFLLCTIIFFSLNSCSKESEATKTVPISLNADKNQYAPYEIVTITSSENLFTVQSFTAKINNIEMIINSNENIASFVLPNLTNGNYNLSFTLNGKNYIVPITVSSLSNVLSADQYFNEIQTSMNQNIIDLNSKIIQLEQISTNPGEYLSIKNDLIKYTNLLNNYKSSYNNLSIKEKEEFAKYMAVNKSYIDDFNNLTSTLNSNTNSLRQTQFVLNYEEQVEIGMGAFTSSVIYTVAHIPFILAGAELAAITSLNPFISVGAILGAGIVTGSFIVNVLNTATMGVKLTSKALKPFEFNSSPTQTVYNSGLETVSVIESKYRSLMNSDGNNSGSTINSIVEKYNSLMEKYNSFRNNLPEIFKPSFVMTSLKNTFNNTTRSIYNQYVSITNNSNPNVTLQQLNQADGSIKIKATTTASTDQSFTYDVNYTNSNFTSGLKKTVSAKVTAVVDSLLIYKASAIGVYKVYGPPALGNGPNTELQCELKDGGIAVYTINNDPSWPNGYSWNIGWSLTKVNNKYYILTGWTNPGYLQAEAQPLKYPVSSFIYRHSYVK